MNRSDRQTPGTRGRLLLFALYHRHNPYARQVQRILQEAGWDVTLEHRIGGRDFLPLRSYDLIVLNWLEDYPLRPRGIPKILSFLYWITPFCGFLLRIRLSGVPVIYVRHNELQNDAVGRWEQVSRVLIRMVKGVAHFAVVHVPGAQRYGDSFRYVPHHLHRPTARPMGPLQVPLRSLCFGRLVPAKRIEDLIDEWPDDQPLTICGATPYRDYAEYLQRRAHRRSIELRAGFLRGEDLDALLLQTDVVVLPRSEGRAIVSGTFFHAISMGCVVLARRAPYIEDIASQFPYVVPFSDRDELLRGLSGIRDRVARGVSREQVTTAAQALFGDDVVREGYERVLHSWSTRRE